MKLSERTYRFQTSSGLTVLVSALAILGLVYFAWPVYRAFLPLQINGNEVFNANHTDMFRAGQPLYPADNFITNNYPPLSFQVVSTLSTVTGVDALYMGRLLSLAAVIATTFSVWSSVRSLGGSSLAATLGALWWFASMARWYPGWVGMNDPHLVALAMMAGALAYALRKPDGKRATVAIAVMAVAGFYKHNLIATPATTLCWLTLRDWRQGLCLGLVGTGTIAVGLALCSAVFGDTFIHSLLLPRHYEIKRLLTVTHLQFIAPALIIAATWAAYRRESSDARFVLIFVAIGFFSFLLQSLADGVSYNAVFELVFAVAIGIGRAFDDLTAIPMVRRWGLERGQMMVVCILIGRLLLSPNLSAYLVLLSPEFRSSLHDRVVLMQAERARISTIPDVLVCSIGLTCRFAQKPFVFDEFIVMENLATGRISQSEMAAAVSDRQLQFERIDPRVDVSAESSHRLEDLCRDTLQATYPGCLIIQLRL